MNANARLHSALGRANAIAAKYGHDGLAADFAAAQARVAALRVVRLRQINRVPGTMPTMPARARARRITTARAFAHRRGTLPRGQETDGGRSGQPVPYRSVATKAPTISAAQAHACRIVAVIVLRRIAIARRRPGARPRDGPAAVG